MAEAEGRDFLDDDGGSLGPGCDFVGLKDLLTVHNC